MSEERINIISCWFIKIKGEFIFFVKDVNLSIWKKTFDTINPFQLRDTIKAKGSIDTKAWLMSKENKV